MAAPALTQEECEALVRASNRGAAVLLVLQKPPCPGAVEAFPKGSAAGCKSGYRGAVTLTLHTANQSQKEPPATDMVLTLTCASQSNSQCT
jgi:hypothetical protein